MYLQRLIKDDRTDGVGFNYDYMGSAEFEFGSTRKARIKLAKLQIDGKLGGKRMRFFERWGRSVMGPADVFVFGSKDYIATLGTDAPVPNVPGDLVVTTFQESARVDNPEYIGWMRIEPYTEDFEPLLIIRVSDDNIQRGNKFLQKFMDGILNEEQKAAKQEVYSYANGYSLRRVNGPVYLPKNEGTPIEGGGQWVMFDEDNNALDRDKYFSDITDRFQRRIGEPVT